MLWQAGGQARNDTCLWNAIFESKYLKNASILDTNHNKGAVALGSSVAHGANIVRQGLVSRIGDQLYCSFLH